MLRWLLLIVTLLHFAVAEQNRTKEINETAQKQMLLQRLEQERLQKIAQYEKELQNLNKELAENIWIKKYENYKTYFKIKKQLDGVERQLKRAKKRHKKELTKELLSKK